MRRIEVAVARPDERELDLLAVAVTEPADALPSAAARLDAQLGGRLSALARDGELRGAPSTAPLLHLNGELGAKRVAAVGVGPADAVAPDSLRTAAATVTGVAKEFGGTVGWLLDESLALPLAEQARAVVDGTLLGDYDPGLWKTSDDGRRAVERLLLLTERESEVSAVAERAATAATWTNRARDLANMPPNELTPERLAARAAEIAGEVGHVRAEALGPEQMRELGMGAFGAVAQGSHNPAQLIVMRYEPPDAAGELVLGLVGKAITFDTGGISIKPALYMEDMKGDMSGGGAVIEATGALADLGIPVRTLTVVAATENMPGGGSYRPGDILRAMNGKTIEVVNTDAEGRLVLADALWYCRQQGATHLLDLATLTGAMELALGDLYAGLFANDDEWRDAIVAAGEASGDLVWPFPLHPRYRRYIDSHFADMKNSSILRQGSPALAAEFLHEFVGEGPWAHLDIAGPAFFRYSRGDYLTQRGGTGFGVRLIVELAASLASRESG